TQGEAIINHRLRGYDVTKGEFSEVSNGAIVSSETGKATGYAIDRLQDRGKFFIDPNQEIYKGQVVGENNRQDDMGVNLIKGKKLTNVRASGSDEGLKIAPKVEFSLEECLEYIREDEYLEVTPVSLRMRKINFV
ncbi:MAG: translational GTPase TypA, partial [Lutimonas sp.]